MRSKPYRLHQVKRYKRRVEAFLRHWFILIEHPETKEEVRHNQRFVGMHYQNRKNCSCHMCGNPRHFYTNDENKHHRDLVENVRFEDGLKEL